MDKLKRGDILIAPISYVSNNDFNKNPDFDRTFTKDVEYSILQVDSGWYLIKDDFGKLARIKLKESSFINWLDWIVKH
jgi:hypothetical protein